MIRRTPQAEDEIVEAAAYIAIESPAGADRFFRAVDETLRFLHDAPAVGHALQLRQARLVPARVWPISGLPNHLMVYHQIEGGIELLHVVHGARDPGHLLDLR